MPESFRFLRPASSSRPQEDAWFVPYNKPAQGQASSSSFAIGQSPTPTRHSSGNLLSYFASPTSPSSHSENKGFRFPSSRAGSPTKRAGQTRAVSQAASSSSLLDASGQSRLSTSNSVPTGLSAKLLFSPLAREVNGTTYIPAESPTPTRQRTFSAPQRRRKPSNAYQEEHGPRQWAAPTICDKLVLAKPHITPHFITPPGSPDELDSDVFSGDIERVVNDGKQRVRERDEWASYVKFRGRSRSFGNEAPRFDAPIIGNAKIRAAEHERRASVKSRSSSVGSKSRWIPRHRGTQSASDLRPSFLHMDSSKSDGVTTSFGFAKRTPSRDRSTFSSGNQSPVFDGLSPDQYPRTAPYNDDHSRSRSSPNLSVHQSNRIPPGPPPRTLRIRNPPIKKSGVIIIGAEAEDTQKRRQAPTVPIDFGKPLPELPQEPQTPQQGPNVFDSMNNDIGRAISPLIDRVELQPASTMTPIMPSPASARSHLAQQHARSRTLKAFKTPTSARTSLRAQAAESSMPANTPRSESSAVSLASPPGSAGQRRPTALEEAIGRCRAASTSSIENRNLTPTVHLFERPRTIVDETGAELPRILATAPSVELAKPLVHPIVSENHNALAVPPLGARADSNFSQSSKNTVYTDASEGWSRTGSVTPEGRRLSSTEDTPSPGDELTDKFNGLFFRTPQDTTTPLLSSASRSYPRNISASHAFSTPASNALTPTGLGFGLEGRLSEPRRQSYASGGTSDGTETMEIATPVYASDSAAQQSAYLRYIGQDGAGSPVRLVRGYDVPIGDMSSSQTPSRLRQSETNLSSHSSQEFRLAAAPIRRPTLIATPPQVSNSGGERRRSFVADAQYYAESDDSPGVRLDSPLHTFGANHDTELANPLDSLSPDDYISSSAADSYTPKRDSAITQRYSAVPSFVQDFPSPPIGTFRDTIEQHEASSPHVDMNTMGSNGKEDQHEMAFGQVVTGPPGAGKTTYCHGMHQFLTALGRPVHVINLDPAVPEPPYPCSINITELITLESVMEEYQLGPNGAMLYVAEYLEENIDWLIGRLDEVLKAGGADGGEDGDEETGIGGAYVIFDTPGQVELWTNHESLRRVIERLTKMDYRLSAVHLSDAHYITDASKFISVTLLALRAMMQLELPHINVLSKIDLLASYGELPFDLRYYAECRDLDYLLDSLDSEPGLGKERMKALNRAMVELVEDYGLVSFETLAVEDKKSMLKLIRTIDQSNGYIHLPGQSLPENVPGLDQMPRIDELGDIDDVQERWGPNREVYDAAEEEEWQREWQVRGGKALGPAATIIRPPEGMVRPEGSNTLAGKRE